MFVKDTFDPWPLAADKNLTVLKCPIAPFGLHFSKCRRKVNLQKIEKFLVVSFEFKMHPTHLSALCPLITSI